MPSHFGPGNNIPDAEVYHALKFFSDGFGPFFGEVGFHCGLVVRWRNDVYGHDWLVFRRLVRIRG